MVGVAEGNSALLKNRHYCVGQIALRCKQLIRGACQGGHGLCQAVIKGWLDVRSVDHKPGQAGAAAGLTWCWAACRLNERSLMRWLLSAVGSSGK